MEKRNEVAAGRTLCDYCPRVAVTVSPSGEALCSTCARDIRALAKEAQEKVKPLKSAPPSLSAKID